MPFAMQVAERLPHVPLPDAVQLAVLSAKHEPPRFDALAQRCLVRLIEERRLSLREVLWAVQRFQDVREGQDGQTGLLNLTRQKAPR